MKSSELLKMNCPGCGTLGSLRKIIYGEPSADFEFDKYIVGGCMPEENINTGCKTCDWVGFK